MTRLIPILLLLALSPSLVAQGTTVKSLPLQPAFYYLNGNGGLILNTDQESRYSTMFYNNYSVFDLQVVSVHQSQVQQDLVYFIDQQGNTLYRTYAPTAPINMGLTNRAGRDSLNPYGARDLGESLLTGVLNTLFSNKRVRFIRR